MYTSINKSPETIALTLFVVVFVSMVISQLAIEVSIIPEWNTFFTKNNNYPKGITCGSCCCRVLCRHSMVYKDK